MEAMKTKELLLEEIRIDGGTQIRTSINEEVVADYAERMENGDEFPPAIIYFDGSDNWLADGFHRYHANKKAGIMRMPCEIRSGTKRDAILYAVGANHANGMRRTNADKRRAVETLLNDPEWGKWSDRKIAELCAVSHPFVANVRASLETVTSDRTYTDKHGNESTMNTANIGRRVLASEIGEDDDGDAQCSGKQYMNTDTGEVLDESQVAVITTKQPKEKTFTAKSIAPALQKARAAYKLASKPWSQVPSLELRQLCEDVVNELERFAGKD